MTVFIGDVHGLYKSYKQILDNCENSIQVGDLGLGFRFTSGPREGEFTQNPPYYKMKEGNHRFIRGNHDNPGECRKNSQWIPDGTVEGDTMFVGGALSIDKQFRMEDYTYWKDEELDQEALDHVFHTYLTTKPRVMITHECPEQLAFSLNGAYKAEFPSRTRTTFGRMWDAYTPEVWVFGHWHTSFDQIINGTRFICLDELEVKVL